MMALNGVDISAIDSESLARLVKTLKSERDQKITEGEDCEGVDVAYRSVKAMHVQRLKLDAQAERRADLGKRLSAAKAELAALRETVAIQARNIEAELAEQADDLEWRHEQEIEALALEWESEPKMRLYNRPSGFLQTLRNQAKLLLNTRRYDEMDACVKQADGVEAKETVENRRKQRADYEDAVLVMQRRHVAEKALLKTMQANKRAEHRAAEAFDVRVLKQRMRNLEIELEASNDPDRLWNLRHRFDAKVLGKRPKVVPGVSIGKRPFRIEDCNTMNLPPLVEPRRGRKDAPPGSSRRLRRTLNGLKWTPL
jgi:hypothetical protein